MNDKIVGRPIRLNVRKLKPKNGYVEVLLLGDVHWGSPQCDKERFLANVDWCLKNGIYVMCMGDMLESATRESVGAGVYEQESITDTQHEQMAEILRPLAEAGLIIGYHTGNHEERVYNMTGVNIAKAMARELKIPYLGDACWQEWRVGKQVYTAYTLHGRTGSRYDGTALKALENIGNSYQSDLIAMGHAHKCVNSIRLMEYVDRKSKSVKQYKQYMVITGGYLKNDGGYAQKVGLPLAKLGSPKVRLYADRHEIVISW